MKLPKTEWLKPYTVIFYIDGDRAMETFVEKVHARSSGDAFDVAVQQAKDSGCSSSGYSISEDDWDCATGIITIAGFHEYATD